MLLEFKIIFILPAEQHHLLPKMPIIFECLLSLISPVDKHIFTQIPLIYSEDMCMIM